jgi:2-dehydro-3-deoxyphosphogluconate aldolase/(4S)-4-hydroxy-2-oxoglutarate aldolase
LEITLRNDYGLHAIKQLKQALPEAIIGAGTVLTPQQYQACVDAGADFIVSPGCTVDLLAYGSQSTVPLLPGIASVSEAMQAMTLGYRRFKLFPAAVVGGIDALKAFAGPLSQLKFCPTGGIREDDLPRYLSMPNVACVGGSWLTPKDAIARKDWQMVETLAARAVAIANDQPTAASRSAALLESGWMTEEVLELARPFMEVAPGYVEAQLAAVDDHWGGAGAMLRAGFGFDDQRLADLRNRLLD